MRASILLLASLATTSAFSPAPARQCTSKGPSPSELRASRREAVERFGSAALSAGAVLLTGNRPAGAAAATQEEEFNQLVDLLKARSEENREANANYAMRADKLSDKDFQDVKTRRPKLIIVQTSKGDKIFTKEEFSTLDRDGKIKTIYGTRMKQGGGEMKDYNDITYVLTEM
mmetsp:Transcript_18670/g.40068  ORF Transcript_18670/g.40068 Transcript_18670/m.40068 type:complete len:173 (-) Transcript_18670:401-919(-)|eukprot:CAMPEP_0172555174 /NCGR_PEP_ID=MMETSP1067-20121228/58253_1 /TAXON_ID=265564 ORGANISM="Thalassiosira punctigera, Strain Tpunct2005C2" /NCGR_SAMPLE_ID=MMETSP1067 /ASSEMBLY_ACC=CAM_ASM_000444 /LENGTH=172 /DNA_ID=CAMNT_0013343687 /DNA_START=109 /DNA_END=627 /DNA_ORIENTATION=-